MPGPGDKKEWEKERHKACKGSGIKAACDLWNAACLELPEVITADGNKLRKALAAIDEMEKAIRTANRKLAEAKRKIQEEKRAKEAKTNKIDKDSDKELGKCNVTELMLNRWEGTCANLRRKLT
jgi:hypothetical protein